MYILLNPNHASVKDPASYVLRKGICGVTYPACVFDEESGRVAKFDKATFESTFGDCSELRNVVQEDGFYRVTTDNPYADTDSDVPCGEGLIIHPGGKSFTLRGRDYELSTDSGLFLNKSELIREDIDEAYILHALTFLESWTLRIMVRKGTSYGIVTVLFDAAGLITDKLGYGFCQMEPINLEGKRKLFADGSSLY